MLLSFRHRGHGVNADRMCRPRVLGQRLPAGGGGRAPAARSQILPEPHCRFRTEGPVLLGWRSRSCVRAVPPPVGDGQVCPGWPGFSPGDEPLAAAVERVELWGARTPGAGLLALSLMRMKGQFPELDAAVMGKRGDLGRPSAVPRGATRATVVAEPVLASGRDGRSHRAVLPHAACGATLGSHSSNGRPCPAAGGGEWAVARRSAGLLFCSGPASARLREDTGPTATATSAQQVPMGGPSWDPFSVALRSPDGDRVPADRKPRRIQSQHGSRHYLEPSPMLPALGEPPQARVESRMITVWFRGRKAHRQQFVRRSHGICPWYRETSPSWNPKVHLGHNNRQMLTSSREGAVAE